MKYAAVFVLLLSTILGAGIIEASHSLGFEWHGNTISNLVVYDATLDARNDVAIIEAVANWNISPPVNMTIQNVPGDCAYRKGAIVICEVPPCAGNNATIIISGGQHISKVKINLMSECTTYEHLSGACHELGHALGLNHRDLSANSCLANNGSKYPDAHDYEQLEAMY